MREPAVPFADVYAFDDLLMVPQDSDVLPRDADLSVDLGRGVRLSVPVFSAAMDTVTLGPMAVAMARYGGCGVVHRNMSAEAQVREVQKVKLTHLGTIVDPVCIGASAEASVALELLKKHGIGGLPVVTSAGELEGVLTRKDLQFCVDKKQKVRELMTKENLVTASYGVSIKEARALLRKHRIEKLPLLDSSNRIKGLITLSDLEQLEKFPRATRDQQGRLFVGAAVGVGRAERERAEQLVGAGVDMLNVDTAHGHAVAVCEQLKQLKQAYPKVFIMGGNVVTQKAAEALFEAGADAVKVGVGPGSICTTRIMSGVGVPQASAIMWCYKAGLKHKKPIVADGGLRFSGDVAKALALGASAVMMGNYLAGTDASPGRVVTINGRNYKQYRGMGSRAAMRRGPGGKDRYKQSHIGEDEGEGSKFVPEGVEGHVPYKGPLEDALYQLEGGLRAAMGYVGASSVQQLRARATFVKQSTSALQESKVHSLIV